MKKKLTKTLVVWAAIVGVVLSIFLLWKWIKSRDDQPEDLSKYFSTIPRDVYEYGIQQKYAIKNFDDISDDLQTIIDLIAPYRDIMEKAEYNSFGVTRGNDYACITSSTTKTIWLNPFQQNSLKAIAESFSIANTGSLTAIGIESGQIKFLSEWRNYAVVYTDDDIAPTTLCFPEADVRVKKIQPHWYHVFDVN